MRKHVGYILHICNQRTYLLTQLKRQRLPQTQVQSVFYAIIPARVLYASPAWRDYLSAANIDSVSTVIYKSKAMEKFGKFVTGKCDVSQLFEKM